MNVNILTLKPPDYPPTLSSISQPPSQLYWKGVSLDEVLQRPRVAVVGSRKASPYGQKVTACIAGKLARAGVVIISGLAFGIDACAHKAALNAGGLTVAVLPTPISQISPASNAGLARQIIESGGALVSEYPAGSQILVTNFIARNRIVSALAEVLVITEAARNSGSLHTARFALEQGKTVMAVPGNINNPLSEGCNNLIKSGALPVTTAEDIFFALGIMPQSIEPKRMFQGPPNQQMVLDLISNGVHEQEQLAVASKLSSPEISSTLTNLELQGYIRPLGAGNWTIA